MRNDRLQLPIPALILRREVGFLCRKGERELTDYRICNLEASKFHTISPAPDQAGVSAMEFDDEENRFLLCGSSRGSVSIIDFEHRHGDITNQLHKRLVASRRSFHKYLITSCQWYPVDSGLFATSSMDKTVKVWDSNRLRAIDTFEFDSPVAQLHWGSSNSASLIAVAISSSNVHFLDPRTGSSIQHLRCKGERISSLWWKRASNFHLLTGSESGRIFLWDVRSGKSELAQLSTGKQSTRRKRKAEPANTTSAHSNPVICVKDTRDGEKIVSMSLNRTLNCWDARSLAFENSVEVDYEGIASKAPVFFETCHEGSRLWAFVPTDTNLTVQDLSSSCKPKANRLLQGHFQAITACAYRSNYHQLVTASTDRLVLVWTPGMDERRPEQEAVLSKLHEDAYSDEDE